MMSNWGLCVQLSLALAIFMCLETSAADSETTQIGSVRKLLDVAVTAPLTKVDVDKKDGVYVVAPGTVVDLGPGGSGLIQFPGGQVDLGRRHVLEVSEKRLRELLDVAVSAPGTTVDSNKQDGTTVQAPFTKVDASKNNGVHVVAPGTIVDLGPGHNGIIKYPGGQVNLGGRRLLQIRTQRQVLDAKVVAPGTAVNSDDEGTKVDAPDANVNVGKDGSGTVEFPGGGVTFGK